MNDNYISTSDLLIYTYEKYQIKYIKELSKHPYSEEITKNYWPYDDFIYMMEQCFCEVNEVYAL